MPRSWEPIESGDRGGHLPPLKQAVGAESIGIGRIRGDRRRRMRSAISSLLQVTRNRLSSNRPHTRASASPPCNEQLAPEHRPPSTKRSAMPSASSWSRAARTSSTRQDSYWLSSDINRETVAAGFTDPGEIQPHRGDPSRRPAARQLDPGPVRPGMRQRSGTDEHHRERGRAGRTLAGDDPEQLPVATGAAKGLSRTRHRPRAGTSRAPAGRSWAAAPPRTSPRCRAPAIPVPGRPWPPASATPPVRPSARSSRWSGEPPLPRLGARGSPGVADRLGGRRG